MKRFTKIHFDGDKKKNIPFPKVTLTPERQRALTHAQHALRNKTLFERQLNPKDGLRVNDAVQESTITDVYPSFSADRRYMGYYITIVYYIPVSNDYEYVRECKDQQWRQIATELYLQQRQMDTLLNGDALITAITFTFSIVPPIYSTKRVVIALSKDALLNGLYDIIEPLYDIIEPL